MAHYEEIAEAPDAVARLRRFVVDIAVRGAIVAHDPVEKPDPELLARLGQPSASSEGSPRGWLRARVGDLLDFQYGKGLKASDREDAGPIPVYGSNGVVGFTSVPLTRQPSIIVGRKGSAGALNLCTVPSWTTDVAYFIEVPSYFDFNYLFHALTALDLGTLGKGVKPGLSRSDAYALVLAVPPVGEQRRIVAKIDELMALCDELEAARTAREAARDRLAAASLARLNTPNPGTFQADARFALDALPALTARPGQIAQLRNTILSLAVRGGLSGNPAWSRQAVRLGDFASLQNGYAFKSEWFSKSGTRLVRNANVGHGSLNWSDEVRLPDTMIHEFERFRLNEGDIVLSLDRPFIVSGTKVARVAKEDLPALLLQRVGRFVLSKELDASYLFLWINSPHFSAQIDPGRSNGVPHISSKQVETAEIYLPPPAEQRRIAAEVERLMTICDELEASLTAADSTRRKLLEALLAEALSEPAIAKAA
ncbi:restriction endonuclease subunit S [Phenylobacterium zucineum]|uniref:restriction endonuclease subunit S n=1 Tax=Phenylobacterium zucineum TaxID=284016 RepID=UPI0011D1073F|nr:restriction endonuclease subunit S [Phenylobacterium zucineum]